MSDEIHKHYHIHLWPNISTEGWFAIAGACMVAALAFAAHG